MTQIKEKHTEPSDGSKKNKMGRFAWVKRLVQPRSTSSAKEILRHNLYNPERVAVPLDIPPGTGDSVLTEDSQLEEYRNENRTHGPHSVNFELETDSRKLQSKSPSLVEGSSTFTRPDNVSTLPVISMSTMSARSSTFSEGSQQSTSNTMASEHPTLFTNASTTGIPPASILDRRDRVNRQLSMNSHHYATNNGSIHTFNTAMSPRSLNMNSEINDTFSMGS